MISKITALKTSSLWYCSQWSALYQFQSSGIFNIADILKYLREIQRNLEPEYFLYPTILTKKNKAELTRLKTWFEYKAKENNVIIDWYKHSFYGYLIPYIKSNINNIEINNLQTFN
jgi:ubiquinone/menaquinone biosynthesis C-methylase UbiE